MLLETLTKSISTDTRIDRYNWRKLKSFLGVGRMKTISDLSDDLICEILYRVPITSLSALRSTSKRLNNLSKTHVFGKKAARNQQFLGFILVNYKICSLRFNFQGISNNKNEIFADQSMKIKICNLEDVLISQLFQCDGLLLCATKDNSSLLVWNPYLGQTKWIQTSRNRCNSYALGYDDNKNYKILKFLYNYWEAKYKQRKYQIEVYDFSSNSWRVLDVNFDCEEPNYETCVSLKGNTYFLGREITHNIEDHLVCFDFTEERFGPRLPLPFIPRCTSLYDVTLSCVRDEKLALLYNHFETLETIKIWISTKIEHNAVSWSMFFKVDRDNMVRDFPHPFEGISFFFIDEEKKVAVLSHKRPYQKGELRPYMIGVNRFVKYVNVLEGMKNHWDYSNLVGSSYFPSLVQLKVNQP